MPDAMMGPVRIRTARKTFLASACMMLVVAGVACASPDTGDATFVAPTGRAAMIEVTGCGLAGSSQGSGIAVGGDLVVVPAHLVLQADTVEVNLSGGAHTAAVVAVDRLVGI